MKVLLMTGSHPRHRHIAKCLKDAGLLSALVIEQREEFIPPPPSGLLEEDRLLFIRHFVEREQAEHRAFNTEQIKWDIPVFNTTPSELNSTEVGRWVVSQKPDVVITYGVHKINQELLDKFPAHSWNIHGGLSPWYRGNITLFWPFYFLKPNWSGMTIHRLTSKLDGGGIIHHSVPELNFGEGIHDVASNAVKQVSEDIVAILKKLSYGETIIEVPQKSSGKLFTSNDWEAHHLRIIYKLFNNDIVDHYLRGELGKTEPPLVRAF
ncbi:methionyl-tRNA formyltransferase [Paenibacillus sp. IHB B 3415]|uniref:formyltransferase family protein n=1 Tax=Paenibacillus sp. IHB B 3415 TaxID=867080 RepID=UPI0005753534|nr:formyltransferase family protein [Paenibacillus sp. IHB B 3415]KHL94003.1 methionyl-tRNA formyltransferase [Paenibacillus sp. IHB B 3415]